jgi:hypothetical protein
MKLAESILNKLVTNKLQAHKDEASGMRHSCSLCEAKFKIDREQVRTKGGAEIKDMNPETYKLRREVIDIIYSLKRVVPDLPRIQVRVVDVLPHVRREEGTLGFAFLDSNTIFIDVDFGKEKKVNLVTTVAHEILHGAYGIRHVNDKKDLMYPYAKDMSSDTVLAEFKKWVEIYKNGSVTREGYKDLNGKKHKWA